MSRTGLISAKCYAAALADCDGGPVTREHYISRTLLKRLGCTLIVRGLRWADGPRTMRDSAMVAKVLCARHNNALGALDTAIGHLFDALTAFHHNKAVDTTIVGEELERWALKVLCGVIASGNIARHDGGGSRAAPPLDYLEVLFGHSEMPEGWGFHFFARHPDDMPGNALSWHPLTYPPSDHRCGQIWGSRVELLGFNYITVMSRLVGETREQKWYRPLGFDLDGRGFIRLDWERTPSSEMVTLSKNPQVVLVPE